MQTLLWYATGLCNAILALLMVYARPRRLKALWLFVGYSLALDVVMAFAIHSLPAARYNVLWQFTDLASVGLECAAVTVILCKHECSKSSFACMFLILHIILRFAEYSWWDNFVGVDLFNYSLNIAGRKAFEMRQWAKIPATVALAVFILSAAQPRTGEPHGTRPLL